MYIRARAPRKRRALERADKMDNIDKDIEERNAQFTEIQQIAIYHATEEVLDIAGFLESARNANDFEWMIDQLENLELVIKHEMQRLERVLEC